MNAKELSNEELANVLRAIKITGICPSRDEKEYLEEAANRIEFLDVIRLRIRNMINNLQDQGYDKS